MSLRQQLILSIVDKGLLALVLAVAGFWLNRYLEAFRSKRALENDLEKLRDQTSLGLLQEQLSKFYWPVHLGLEMDTALWEKILQRGSSDPVQAQIGKSVERDFILPNHEAIQKAIEANIHLAAPAPELQQRIVCYLRHVTIYRALRNNGIWDKDPLAVGEPWPQGFAEAIKAETMAKQTELNHKLESVKAGKRV